MISAGRASAGRGADQQSAGHSHSALGGKRIMRRCGPSLWSEPMRRGSAPCKAAARANDAHCWPARLPRAH